MQADEPETMFFVIGAQKAGTTWLHAWLKTHREVTTGPVKEYSYFSKFHPQMTAGEAPLPRFQALRRRAAMASVLRRSGLAKGWFSAFLRASGDPIAYKSLLRGNATGIRAFGDISPFYSLLGRSAYAEMAGLHDKTRFIFILRDPVERLWSQLQMRSREAGSKEVTKPVLADWKNQRNLMRSRYDRTIAELEAAVPAENILYLFYEDLFTLESLARFCSFLGIAPHPADFGSRVHAGLGVAMPEDWARAARVELEPVYSFAKSKFGPRLPLSWGVSPLYQGQATHTDDLQGA